MTSTMPATPHSQPANQAAHTAKGGETTMIKKIREVLFSGRRKPVRDQPPEFNEELLNAHRENVFVLMHQQIRGMN